MELSIYLWLEDVTVFIRELIRFFETLLPGSKMQYGERYDSWEKVLRRDLYVGDTGIWINIIDDDDLSYLPEEYGTDVNIQLWFNIISRMYNESSAYIAAMVNWIMRTSDTDLAIENECGWLIFKRKKGKIFYAKTCDSFPYDYFPGNTLDFDKKQAVAYTEDDEWVYCSEESIREREHRRKEQEQRKKSD